MHTQQAYQMCLDHLNQEVELHTVNGDHWSGFVENVDDDHVYLIISYGGVHPMQYTAPAHYMAHAPSSGSPCGCGGSRDTRPAAVGSPGIGWGNVGAPGAVGGVVGSPGFGWGNVGWPGGTHIWPHQHGFGHDHWHGYPGYPGFVGQHGYGYPGYGYPGYGYPGYGNPWYGNLLNPFGGFGYGFPFRSDANSNANSDSNGPRRIALPLSMLASINRKQMQSV